MPWLTFAPPILSFHQEYQCVSQILFLIETQMRPHPCVRLYALAFLVRGQSPADLQKPRLIYSGDVITGLLLGDCHTLGFACTGSHSIPSFPTQ